MFATQLLLGPLKIAVFKSSILHPQKCPFASSNYYFIIYIKDDTNLILYFEAINKVSNDSILNIHL